VIHAAARGREKQGGKEKRRLLRKHRKPISLPDLLSSLSHFL
jgi:hypothetical protein